MLMLVEVEDGVFVGVVDDELCVGCLVGICGLSYMDFIGFVIG